MPIITVASTKGGVGKSTFILNLSTALLQKRRKIVILDGDPQNTISKWNKVREYMIEEGTNLENMFVASAQGNTLIELANDKNNQGNIVLIDSPGVADSNMKAALLRSDFVITPCPPSPVDLWEVETLMHIIKSLQNIQNRKIPLLLVFNKVPPIHSKIAITEGKKFFNDNNILPHHILNTYIKERAIFKHSIRDGRGVVEYTPSDSKACDEINSCCDEIISLLKFNKSTHIN